MNESQQLFDEDFDDGKIRTFHAGSKHSTSSGKSHKHYPSCYESHKPLMIGGFKVYGGSCAFPMVTNADIYVGLDNSMPKDTHYPWNDEKGPINIYFHIYDGTPPDDIVEFKKMLEWLKVQLLAGKLIHIGCIGGHGRTGMTLAAFVKVVDGTVDAITYVRNNYCHKAVESAAQVNFLHQHFGIKKVAGSRINVTKVPKLTSNVMTATSTGVTKAEYESRMSAGLPKNAHKAPPPDKPVVPLSLRPELPKGPFVALPEPSLLSIWGRGLTVFDKLKKPAKMQLSQEGVT